MADFLFTQFAAQNINSNTDSVMTSGRSSIGVSPATYIADALATAALFATHPRFVGRSSNGRYFRAMPVGDQIPVELGGAVGDGIANDQPAIQAAIEYAEAIGVGSICFAEPSYCLHCPVRTSDPAGLVGEHLYDGRPLVISAPLVLRSLRHGGSRLVFRHSDGGARQNNWQLVPSASTGQPMVWRGGGLFIKCPLTEPANYADRPGVTLIDMTLDGGIPRGSVFSFPARTSDGDGWDVTDKGIHVEPDRFSGDVRLIRSAVQGFRGELVYQAGLGNGELYMRSAVLCETNGNLFQACGSNLDIDGLFGSRGHSAFEGWSGRRGRLVNAVFEDCTRTGGLAGGKLSSSAQRNTPQRMNDSEVPWLSIDAEFRGCGAVMLGSWVRGRIKLTDSQLILDGTQVFSEGLRDLDLDVISQVDKLSDFSAVLMLGSSTPGKQSLSHVRLRLRCCQTEEAKANGRIHLQPVDYRGSFGPGVVIERSSGVTKRASGPSGNSLTSVTDQFPCFRANHWHRTALDWSGVSQPIDTTPQIVVRGDLMGVTASTNGIWPISLPVNGIQHGHELTIRNNSGQGVFATLAASGAGASLAANRVLAAGQRITVRFDQEFQLWRETLPPPPLKGMASPAIVSIAPGATSPEIVVACPGTVHGMNAAAIPANSLPTDLELCGVRAVTDAVRFRLRNHGSVNASPPQQAWTVSAAYSG